MIQRILVPFFRLSDEVLCAKILELIESSAQS